MDGYTTEYAEEINDWSTTPNWMNRVWRVLRLSGVRQGDVTLDLGCNMGRLPYLLDQDYGVTAYGCDISEAAITAGKKFFKNPLLRHMPSPRQVPFRNSMFDVVFMLHVLASAEDPVALLKDVRRVLKNRGRLVITTPSRLYHSLMAPHNLVTGYKHDWSIKGFHTRSQIESLLYEAGWDISHHEYTGEQPIGLGWTGLQKIRSHHLIVAVPR
jgi:ubiquinone/menaquinone biosynthesis C-methylase UbiE